MPGDKTKKANQSTHPAGDLSRAPSRADKTKKHELDSGYTNRLNEHKTNSKESRVNRDEINAFTRDEPDGSKTYRTRKAKVANEFRFTPNSEPKFSDKSDPRRTTERNESGYVSPYARRQATLRAGSPKK